MNAINRFVFIDKKVKSYHTSVTRSIKFDDYHQTNVRDCLHNESISNLEI